MILGHGTLRLWSRQLVRVKAWTLPNEIHLMLRLRMCRPCTDVQWRCRNSVPSLQVWSKNPQVFSWNVNPYGKQEFMRSSFQCANFESIELFIRCTSGAGAHTMKVGARAMRNRCARCINRALLRHEAKAKMCRNKEQKTTTNLWNTILTHFWPASALLRGHLAIPTLSPPETDPQILERWSFADEVHMGRCIRSKGFGLKCMSDVQRLLWILHVGSVSTCLNSSVRKTSAASCRERHNRNCRAFDDRRPTGPCLPSLGWCWSRLKTSCHMLSCRSWFFKIATSLFAIIHFGPFAWLFINLAMRIRALLPKPTTTLGLVEQAFWRVPLFTEWFDAWGKACRAIETFYNWDFPLGLRVFYAFRSFCCIKEFGDGFGCVIFARFWTSWRKLQVSPLEHCPLNSHCQSPRVLFCSRGFVPWFLTTALVQNFHVWPQKLFILKFWSILLLTIVFNLW